MTKPSHIVDDPRSASGSFIRSCKRLLFPVFLIGVLCSYAFINKSDGGNPPGKVLVSPDMTLQLRMNDGSIINLPVKLECKDSSNCYFVLPQSNYALKDLSFSRGYLKDVKIYIDSMFDMQDKFEYIQTDIVIKSGKRDKSIGIKFQNNQFLFKAFETVKGSEIRLHQEFKTLEFDSSGKLIKTYTEYLY